MLVIEALARIGKRSGVEEKVCNWGKVWSRRKSGIEKTNVKHKRGRELPKVGSPGKLGADATPNFGPNFCLFALGAIFEPQNDSSTL